MRQWFKTLLQWLTHWGRNKMATISHKEFSKAFPSEKVHEFWSTIQWSVFLTVKLIIGATSHYLNQLRLVWWRIHAALLDKLLGLTYSNHVISYCTISYELTCYLVLSSFMMTSSNGNIFRVTGPLCGEFTGPRWIPCTKASDAELWCFLWSAPE